MRVSIWVLLDGGSYHFFKKKTGVQHQRKSFGHLGSTNRQIKCMALNSIKICNI